MRKKCIKKALTELVKEEVDNTNMAIANLKKSAPMLIDEFDILPKECLDAIIELMAMKFNIPIMQMKNIYIKALAQQNKL
jgi:hypothetical protein